MKPFRYLVPVTLLGLAEADLSGCGRSLTFQHTNLFQFGQIQFSFSACTYDSTIGGYRAGVANFNTVDGSAWNVVKAYHAATDGSDELSPYDSWLQDPTQFSGSSRSSGFCSAWKKAANNPDFLTAQATVFSSKYLKPTQSAIDKQGLSLGISEALMYDTAITNGVGSSQGSLGWLIANTNKQVLTDISGHSGNTLTVNGFDVDEIAWVQLFLTQRSAYSSATATAASTKSFRYMVTNILAAIGDIPMLTVNEA
ncbi:hypothetical protein H4R18_001640 [Coemansia javaensis]|uniref:Chitosanase n=1 Tax=Coemansia javaensis TaxID=2761396 RepID=A0A9W8HC38_9FUNG|nr:hypothetical protein H4R18_001640 [Coemansia javaensis]